MREQHRSYSNTRFLLEKGGDDGKGGSDDDDEIPFDLPEVQTANLPEGWTEEETEKLLQEVLAEHERKEAEILTPNWKPGMRKKRRTISYNIEDLVYDYDDSLPRRWTHLDKRSGLVAIKVGMMPFFDEWGERHPCTVLLVDSNIVLGHKTMDKHGYVSVQIAAGQRKKKNVGGTVLGQYKHIIEWGDDPPHLIREFRVSDEEHLIPVGTKLHARHFVPGQNVDISGISKGKGFQGAMKRHNFKGQPASHGVSKSHRALGSTGQCQDPGRVFKGKKMAGRMGGERKTVQNLRVLKVDRGRNLIYVKGGIPGQRGNFVEVKDAIKKPLWGSDKVAPNEDGSVPDRPPLPTFAFDESIDGCGEAGYEEIMPVGNKDPLNYDPEVA